MQVRRIDSDLAGERRRGEAFTVPDLSKLGRYWISHDAIIRQSLLIVKRYQRLVVQSLAEVQEMLPTSVGAVSS